MVYWSCDGIITPNVISSERLIRNYIDTFNNSDEYVYRLYVDKLEYLVFRVRFNITMKTCYIFRNCVYHRYIKFSKKVHSQLSTITKL